MQAAAAKLATGALRISVLIATRNRADGLQLLLNSLQQAIRPAFAFEIIVADNGSTDETPQLLRNWAATGPERIVITEPLPGKCRALNPALKIARGDLLAFLDHDQIVEPNYLVGIDEYFSAHDCAAAQGAILWPKEAQSDPEIGRLLDLYHGIPHVDLGLATQRDRLTGGNMVVRRAVFAQIGPFNEQLGPGAAGCSEDDDIADRILARGEWIGYMKDVCVIHEINRQRLTEPHWIERCRQQGRSRYVYKHNGLFRSILPNLFNAQIRVALFKLVGDIRREYRYRARYYQYREMLRVALASRK